MADLAEFLLARIAEDQKIARDASARDQAWDVWFGAPVAWGEPPPLTEILAGGKPIFRSDDQYGGINQVEHVISWDPARVLAECEAKQRIVAWHRMINGLDTEDRPVRGCGNCIASGAVPPYIIAGPCMTVRLLALPHAHHPDYDESWRP